MTSVFNFVRCFQKLDDNPPEAQGTLGFCIGNCLLAFLSLVSMVYCLALFVWHMSKNGWCKARTIKNKTTWLLISLLFFEVVTATRYTFNLYLWSGNNVLLIFNELIQSLVIFEVCNIFAQQAAVLLSSLAWVPRFLNVVLIVIFLAYIGCTVLQLLQESATNCKNVSFAVTEMVNCLISVMFIFVGYLIEKEFNNQTEIKNFREAL